jgi:hypothetical protein
MARYRQTPDGAVAAYAPASAGPFRCDRCDYFTDQRECRKPEVVTEAKALRGLGRTALRASVDPGGCCNFFEPR